MASLKEAVRRQRRRELDARRGKSRIRLGSCLENWDKLRKTLGFALHSELALYLLDSHFSKVCSRCSGDGTSIPQTVLSPTAASLQQLIHLVHNHSLHCPMPPSMQIQRDPETSIQTNTKAPVQGDTYTQADPKGVPQVGLKGIAQEGPKGVKRAGPKGSIEAELKSSLNCAPKSHMQADYEVSMYGDPKSSLQADPTGFIQAGPKGPKGYIKAGPKSSDPKVSILAGPKGSIQADPNEPVQTEVSLQAQMCLKYACEAGHVFMWCLMQPLLEMEDTDEREDVEEQEEEDTPPAQKSIRKRGRIEVKKGRTSCANQEVASDEARKTQESIGKKKGLGGEYEEPDTEESEEHMCLQDGSDAAVTADESPRNKTQSALPKLTKRGRQMRVDPPETNKADNTRPDRRKRNIRHQLVKDDVTQICGKRKRKATTKLILPCEFSGCWKIFSSRQYLNHHMKFQHVQQKTFICSHPSCGKSFNFKKHLKEHEKLHSDQRNYICEFCARAFRTSSNLSIHRRIHTGEKPLQCEVCGYTCRQKASLNWHMRKHDAESSYQFPCETCGRRFEKRDNVMAHRSKSHPEHLTTNMDTPSLEPTQDDADAIKPSQSPTNTGHDL